MRSTNATLIPTAIPIVDEEVDVFSVFGGGLVVVLTFSFTLLLLIVEGSLNVKGSVHTLKAELKLKGS
jgi:hypothetical protein